MLPYLHPLLLIQCVYKWLLQLTSTCTLQVNDTSGSFIYQDDLQMDDVCSLADNQQTEESLYNQLQRN